MRVLFSKDGFEQDCLPQICVEGSSFEYVTLINTIEIAVKNKRGGDFLILPSDSVDLETKLFFTIKSGDNKLLVNFKENRYQISLDTIYWQEVVDLLRPLTIKKGYQFIEFDHFQLIEDLGLVFRTI